MFTGIFTGDMETMTSGIEDIFNGFFGKIKNGFQVFVDIVEGIIKGLRMQFAEHSVVRLME